MNFKLLSGVHAHGGRVYHPGQIFECETDLAKRFNIPGSVRFEAVPPPAVSEEETRGEGVVAPGRADTPDPAIEGRSKRVRQSGG